MAKSDPRLDLLLRAATAHGEASEPEHEVGDLQQLVIECWNHLTPSARNAVLVASADLAAWAKEGS